MPIIALHGGEDIGLHGDPAKNTANYRLLASGYSTSFAALAAVQAYLAPYVAVGAAIVSPWDIALKHVEADIYEATVNYITPEQQEQTQLPPPNVPELSIDPGTESQHVTQGLEVKGAWPPGTSLSRFNGQINVEIDAKGFKKVKGVESRVAKLTLNVDYNIPTPADPFALARRLHDATTRINSTPWYGFDDAELQYMGGQVRGSLLDRWKMRLLIECSPSVVIPVDFGTPSQPQIEQCFKRGWDYFWIYYITKIVDTPDGKENQPQAKYAFSHRMFDEFDFRYFGLGG